MKIYIEFNNMITHFIETTPETEQDYKSAKLHSVKDGRVPDDIDYYCLCINPPNYIPKLNECVSHTVKAKEIVKMT